MVCPGKYHLVTLVSYYITPFSWKTIFQTTGHNLVTNEKKELTING